MPLIPTPDGRYVFAIETAGEGDGNSAVYDRGVPVWDRFSYEAGRGEQPISPSIGIPILVPPLSGQPIRVTDESDGDFVNRGYPYYSQVVIVGGAILCFAGHVDGHPRFFSVDLVTGDVTRLGPLLTYGGTGEGWYFDAGGWLYLCEGPRLRKINPFDSRADRVVLDISGTHPGCDLWQAHSSDDGQTHSATVRRIVADGAYPKIGTVVYRHGREDYFPAVGELDESSVTSDGSHLIIKESDFNRVIILSTGERRIIQNGEGALGHSDCGPSFAVGEADSPEPGGCVLWDFRTWTMRTLFQTRNMGHVSVRANRCLLSDAMNLSLVALDGSGAQTLLQHGMTGNSYDEQVMANLSPCGRVAAWVSNKEHRMDLYVKVL